MRTKIIGAKSDPHKRSGSRSSECRLGQKLLSKLFFLSLVADRAIDDPPVPLMLAAAAAVEVGVEADVLRRERHEQLGLGGDTHAVRSGLGAGERPAAAAVGLVADVADHLGAVCNGGAVACGEARSGGVG